MRLDKFLVESSVGTRKKVRAYVKEGMVEVNEKRIKDPAMEIDPDSTQIKYLGETVVYRGKVYYMFHKPAGCITARKDGLNKTVLDYFTEVDTGGLFPVGRLDKDTEGLLLLTNDGEFDHKLMCPKQHVEKTYFFWATGILSVEDILRIENGIFINKDESITKPAKLEILKSGIYTEYADEMNIQNTINRKANCYEQSVVAGYLTISEGRKHQVKRMLKAVGCRVVYLKRISVGTIVLDESLKKGEYRQLSESEIEKAFTQE